MSDDLEMKVTGVENPDWMKSQTPKADSESPKSKRTRRTKQQMAEARAIESLSKLGAESVVPTGAVEQVDDHTVRVRIDDGYGPLGSVRTNLPTVFSAAAFVLSILAIIIAIAR